MNRPNKEEYKVFDETQGCKRFTSFLYIEDLEKYCDELEKEIKSLTFKLWLKDMEEVWKRY